MFSVTLLTPFLPPAQPFAAKGSGSSDTKNSRKNFFCGDEKEMNEKELLITSLTPITPRLFPSFPPVYALRNHKVYQNMKKISKRTLSFRIFLYICKVMD
jgi:hypothetical protein